MFNDMKHVRPRAQVPALWAQVVLVVAGLGAGVLINQHFTDRYVEAARQAVRAAHEHTAQPGSCAYLVQIDADGEGE